MSANQKLNPDPKAWGYGLADGEIEFSDCRYADLEERKGIHNPNDDAWGEPVPSVDPEGGLLW